MTSAARPPAVPEVMSVDGHSSRHLRGTTLSSREVARVTHSLELLLSPLAFQDISTWQVQVLRQLKGLLGADVATFKLPLRPETAFVSEELALDFMARFPSVVSPLDRRLSLWRRQVALGVTDRAMLLGQWMDRYLKTRYYNEYIVPARLFDALILNVSLTPTAAESTVAGLWFHHQSDRSRPFGERGLSILRLMLPAFRAGIMTLRRIGAYHHTLGAALDASGQPIALCTLDGAMLHQTPELSRYITRDGKPSALEAAIRQAAVEVARVVRGDRRGGAPGGLIVRSATASANLLPAYTVRVHTNDAEYRLAASLGGAELDATEPVVVVTVGVTEHRPGVPGVMELVDRFGLTRREVEVALLLGEGKAAGEIASALGTSVHTARRHTEHVFAKLGVSSRAAVLPRLMGGGG